MRLYNHFLILMFALCTSNMMAQDLLAELEKEDSQSTYLTTATFKGSRLINGHSVETTAKRELEFIFAHRFGLINNGLYGLFGLDEAFVRIGVQYGLSDRVNLGLGRNSVDKTVDGYLKVKLARQQSGRRSVPVTITWISNAAVRTSPKSKDSPYPIRMEDRMSYTSQVLIARKFSPAFSMQIMPTYLHRNTVEQSIEENKLLVLGAGARMKITRSMAITSEYYHRLNSLSTSPYHNALGLGLDIETGGHVFQLVFTNTRGLTERAFLAETTGNIKKADIHFGFNVTRTF